MPLPLSESVYLILGATGGIGSAISEKLSTLGAQIVLASHNEQKLNTLKNIVEGSSFVVDVTDFDQVQEAVQFSLDTYGRLDGVVNCVGSILLKPAHLTSLDEYNETLALNLHSSFYLLKAAARPMMKQKSGSIVFMSSAVARTGIVNHEAIAAAKAGLTGLALSAAATYARWNIRVNCVAPGLVDTPLSAHLLANEKSKAASESMHALGRLGTAEEVAEAVVWLLDDTKSGWITGQTFGVDGGLGTLRPR